MNENLTIRPFVPTDARAFHDLNMAWIASLFQPEPEDEATLLDPEGTILALGGQIFVAEENSVVVGCVALVPMPDLCYEIAKMTVTPDAQGRGIGRKLLEEAIAWAGGRGAKRLFLGSNTRLTPALRLYESVGFQHLPPERRPVSPYARANVFMELRLTEAARTEDAAQTRPEV